MENLKNIKNRLLKQGGRSKLGIRNGRSPHYHQLETDNEQRASKIKTTSFARGCFYTFYLSIPKVD